jgi:Flp pilus assembly pilin Flp
MNQQSHIGAVWPARRSQTPHLPIPRGQGMTEYIIIVALVAVAAIGVYTLLGQTLRNQTAGLALELSGQDGGTAINNAQGNANSAQGGANQRKGLDTYNAQNRP